MSLHTESHSCASILLNYRVTRSLQPPSSLSSPSSTHSVPLSASARLSATITRISLARSRAFVVAPNVSQFSGSSIFRRSTSKLGSLHHGRPGCSHLRQLLARYCGKWFAHCFCIIYRSFRALLFLYFYGAFIVRCKIFATSQHFVLGGRFINYGNFLFMRVSKDVSVHSASFSYNN